MELLYFLFFTKGAIVKISSGNPGFNGKDDNKILTKLVIFNKNQTLAFRRRARFTRKHVFANYRNF